MRRVFILLLLTILWSTTFGTDVSLPGDRSQPVKVSTSIYLLDLDSIDNVQQSLEANIYYMATWNDPRQAHAGSGEITKPLQDVWHPRLQILNQQRVWRTLPEIVSIDPQGNVIYDQRVWGQFSQPLVLHEFPFDTQQIQIPLIASGYNSEEVQLISHSNLSSGIEESLSIPDWDVLDWKFTTGNFTTNSELLEELSSFTLSLTIKRRHLFYEAKIILPLILIMAMSWVVFWMDPTLGGGGQIGISVTAMLTLIAHTFAASESLPKVPYLTRLDYFILSATILVFLALIESSVAAYQNRSGRPDLALRIDKHSRWVFPLAFMLMTAITLGNRPFN